MYKNFALYKPYERSQSRIGVPSRSQSRTNMMQLGHTVVKYRGSVDPSVLYCRHLATGRPSVVHMAKIELSTLLQEGYACDHQRLSSTPNFSLN
jgi:hypothetical protein